MGQYSSRAQISPSPYSEAEKEFLWKIHHTIEGQFGDSTFGVEKLAEILNVSRFQLSRRMAKLSGYTPGKYLHRYRLNVACVLLEKSQFQVKNIALTSGFNSYKVFADSFKREYNLCPSHFRRSSRQSKGAKSGLWHNKLTSQTVIEISRLISERGWSKRVFQFILGHLFHEGLTLGFLTKELKISTAQLSRKMRADLGISPMRLVQYLRVLYAEELLANDSLSVAEIAHQAGFFDEAHFCRAFKSIIGRSPTVYRSQHAYILAFSEIRSIVYSR